MKALVYTAEKTLSYLDYDDTIQNPNEELIKIDSVGICGSDMHAFLGHDERRPSPLILGHEPSGTIMNGPNSGSKVTINPLVTCGKCFYCLSEKNNLCTTRQIISMPPREGAFAELISMPPENLVYIPEGIEMEKASLAEPLACGWHAIRLAEKASDICLKDANCLIIGGGAIGLGSALALKAKGATKIFLAETNILRHKVLNDACEMEVFNPITEKPLKEGGAHIVIDAVGLKVSREMASQFISPGGVIMHIGLGEPSEGLDIRRMTLQEISFIGTYTYTSLDFKETAKAIFENKLGQLDWIDVRPLKDGQKSFNEILKGEASSPKIILKP